MKSIKKAAALLCLTAMLLAMVPTIFASETQEDLLYRLNPICGDYLGKNSDGLYEFEVTIPDDRESQPKPNSPLPIPPQRKSLTNAPTSAAAS